MLNVTLVDRKRKNGFSTSMLTRNAFLAFLTSVAMGILIFVAILQGKGFFFDDVYPNCKVKPEVSFVALEDISDVTSTASFSFGFRQVKDNTCDMLLNTAECQNDGGDCDWLNANYPNCIVPFPSKINDGRCDGLFSFYDGVTGQLISGSYNSEVCGFDGGDCKQFNSEYPNCTKIEHPFLMYNDVCDEDWYDTQDCGWDNGACGTNGQMASEEELKLRRPNCIVDDYTLLGNGKCDSQKGVGYNTLACGWDGGDCEEWNNVDTIKGARYEYCQAPQPYKVGNDICDVGPDYQNIDCEWDGGDCEQLQFEERFPECLSAVYCKELWERETYCMADYPGATEERIYDAVVCQKVECGWAHKDCSVRGYPECHPVSSWELGNGVCDDYDMNYFPFTNPFSESCGFDLGDCIE